jgi:hypothetical protein
VEIVRFFLSIPHGLSSWHKSIDWGVCNHSSTPETNKGGFHYSRPPKDQPSSEAFKKEGSFRLKDCMLKSCLLKGLHVD